MAIARSARLRECPDRTMRKGFVIAGITLVMAGCGQSSPSSHRLGDGGPTGASTPPVTAVATASSGVGNGAFVPATQQCPASTLAHARAAVAYPLLVPHDEMASEESLSEVHLCPGDEAVLKFDSGIEVVQQSGGLDNPLRAWQRLAAQDPQDTSVGEARGQPAALIDALKDPPGTARGSVTVIDGHWIWVIGNGAMPIADLVRVMDSLAP